MWCRLTITGGPSFIAGLGDKPCTRRSGNILIQCFARPNTGDREVTELSDTLLAHFEYFSRTLRVFEWTINLFRSRC